MNADEQKNHIETVLLDEYHPLVLRHKHDDDSSCVEFRPRVKRSYGRAMADEAMCAACGREIRPEQKTSGFDYWTGDASPEDFRRIHERCGVRELIARSKEVMVALIGEADSAKRAHLWSEAQPTYEKLQEEAVKPASGAAP